MDIKTMCMVGSFILSFCTFIGGALAFAVVKFNDISHVESALKENKEALISFKNETNGKLDKITELVQSNETKIAVIDERCKSHKKLKTISKKK